MMLNFDWASVIPMDGLLRSNDGAREEPIAPEVIAAIRDFTERYGRLPSLYWINRYTRALYGQGYGKTKARRALEEV